MASGSYDWKPISSSLSELGVEEFLDGCRRRYTPASNLVKCQICDLNVNFHQMRYRIIACKSSSCDEYCGQACKWKIKVLTCQDTKKTDIYSSGSHNIDEASPKKPKLTLGMKRLAQQLVGQHAKPNRIRHDILDRFEPERGSAPSLSQVQNFLSHHKRTKLQETDFIEDMEKLAGRNKFHADLNDGDPFFFGFEVNEYGAPVFGGGSDAHLVVGVSTPYMLKLLRHAADFVLHIDVTYKLNQSGYPTTVVGLSDASRSFYPVAFFVTSQVTGPVMSIALTHLFETYKKLTGELPVVRYCMADADKAQYNAVRSVVASKTQNMAEMVYLMCYFHVVKNVGEHASGLTGNSVSLIFHHLYDMHFARDADEFKLLSEEAIKKWKAVPELGKFADYFKKQWLDSQFSNWAVFCTPPGYATTNNPVETFNRTIKQDYTFHSLVKLVGLMDRLQLMCRHWSRDERALKKITIPNREVLNREKKLAETKALWAVRTQRTSVSFLLGGEENDNLRFICQREGEDGNIQENWSWRKICPILKKRHKNRMELQDQPIHGWGVDIASAVCPCRSWFKYGTCVHVVAALRLAGRPILGVPISKRRFVNRRRRIGRGRPATVGPALSLE